MRQGPATARMSSTTMAGHTRRAMVLLPSWPAGPHPLACVLAARGPHSGRAAARCERASCVPDPGSHGAALDHHGLTSVAPLASGAAAAATWPAATLTPAAPTRGPRPHSPLRHHHVACGHTHPCGTTTWPAATHPCGPTTWPAATLTPAAPTALVLGPHWFSSPSSCTLALRQSTPVALCRQH